jgi:hypothetical protein
VRKLKKQGLTISCDVGYRLSVRGTLCWRLFGPGTPDRGCRRRQPGAMLASMRRFDPSNAIWLWAALYAGFYVPYTGVVRAVSRGAWPGAEALAGASILPLSTAISIVIMLGFLIGTGWWRFATQLQLGGISLPRPTRWTALSGLCTAGILTTTTLAYTFEGISIVFAMLLMRGGVLIIAPVVDALTGRSSRWFSWVGLALSLAALVVAFAEDGGYALTVAASLNIALYLGSYFVRLRFMSKLAKSDDPAVMKRYFAEEQLVAAPLSLVLMLCIAFFGTGSLAQDLHAGLPWLLPSNVLLPVAAVGLLSQLVGIFGTLVFLDRSENTFSVPVNRCASILSGVVASAGLALLLGMDWPSVHQLVGAGLVVSAILVLGLVPIFQRRSGSAAAT